MTGVELIATERKRQIEEEGWTAEHDDNWKNEALAYAAVCYALPQKNGKVWRSAISIDFIKMFFPFENEWWKPTPDNRIRELEKAGALIAAEIDRLQRLEKSEGKK